MTTLYLLRHASAEDAKSGQSDAGRALTADGVRKFRQAAEGIARLLADKAPRILWTSPLVRARQTAGILAEQFDAVKCKIDVRVSAHLAPPGDLQAILKDLRREGEDAVAVGHEPILSEWLGELAFGGRGRVEFKKGALAAVALAERGISGQLLYLLQPGLLRQLR